MARVECVMVAIAAMWIGSCDAGPNDETPPTAELYEQHAELRALPGDWVHMFEEEEAGESLVYRPQPAEALPATPFRGSIAFEEDGACHRDVESTTKAPYLDDCAWFLRVDDPLVVSVHDRFGEIARVRIVEATAEVLRFAPVFGGLHDERPPRPTGGGGGGW